MNNTEYYDRLGVSKNASQDEIKKEIISVAALVAEKGVSDKIDIEIQDSLIDDTLKEIGEKTWQS